MVGRCDCHSAESLRGTASLLRAAAYEHAAAAKVLVEHGADVAALEDASVDALATRGEPVRAARV